MDVCFIPGKGSSKDRRQTKSRSLWAILTPKWNHFVVWASLLTQKGLPIIIPLKIRTLMKNYF